MSAMLERIGEVVEVVAYEIFLRCGAESDYCIQHIGANVVIFGGTNRVVFFPQHGWRVDRSACTSRFLEHWDRIKEEYKLKEG